MAMSEFEKAFALERKKQGAGGQFDFGGKQYSTNYAEDKVQQQSSSPVDLKKDSSSKIASAIGDLISGPKKQMQNAQMQEINPQTQDVMKARRQALMNLIKGQ